MPTDFPAMANVDGEITPLEEAKIPILDRGFLYGDSVYEVFRTYSGVPLFCHEHFDRLEHSAKLINMQISQSRDEQLQEMRRTIKVADVPSCSDVYVRWHITRGGGPVDLIPSPEAKTSFVMMIKPVPTWNPEFYSQGMRLAVTRVRRNPVAALSPNIKSGNYLNNILGVSEAIELDADDCLMLNPSGIVTEASNSNVFFVIENHLVTPSQESGVLRGITKTSILKFAQQHDFTIEQAEISSVELAKATECFVTSATREVMPVASLRLESGEALEFPAGGGPQTRKVAAAYQKGIETYVKENADLSLLSAG